MKRKTKTKTPLYTIRTWDCEEQRWTPQKGLSVRAVNVRWITMLKVLRELRKMGYDCGRKRDHMGNHSSDASVLVERTDGKPLKEQGDL